METEDKIIEKLLEMSEKIDKLPSKEEFDSLKETVVTRFDQQGQILERLDQERLFTLERIKRIEADVQTLKTALQIV
ncbi:hypothetical protein HOI18_03435 [Candidatus Uhrbacteria bacterium]|jgi:hypothetical protein|nr:hypothetical protein [Candidatus Uhrbacteria bacterium]